MQPVALIATGCVCIEFNMKFAELTIAECINICDCSICSQCPLFRRYTLFYNHETDQYEHCLLRTMIKPEYAYPFMEEEINYERNQGIGA